jgi:ubiquinone/menaquinone biosynthesis C-methylase UbiE
MKTFKEFEHSGWQEVADRYHDAFAGVTTQSVGPLLETAFAGPGVRLLDLACGPGYAAAAAAQLGAKAHGIDFSSEMVDQARQRHSGVHFEEGDAEQLSIPDAAFDAVVMNYGMLHLSQPERAVAESYRVLRPGGRFAFTVWDTPDKTKGFGIVLEAIQKHGQLDVPIPPGPPFFRFSDPAESTRVLSAAGFVRIQVRLIPQIWRLASADNLFNVFLRSSVRSAALLRAQSAGALAAIQVAIRERMAEYQKGGGFELPMPAVLCSGFKPDAA